MCVPQPFPIICPPHQPGPPSPSLPGSSAPQPHASTMPASSTPNSTSIHLPSGSRPLSIRRLSHKASSSCVCSEILWSCLCVCVCVVHESVYVSVCVYWSITHPLKKNNVICSNKDGPRDCHTECSESEKHKRHILLICGIQINDKNEVIYKIEIDFQTQETNLWLPKGGRA